mmetsp:Transcript_92086/g.288162  ORF Transcript_92086/g.288162 Transcript_92086/m.288162 type:complete len:91 (+) Transcript_92086:922-1194(+)
MIIAIPEQKSMEPPAPLHNRPKSWAGNTVEMDKKMRLRARTTKPRLKTYSLPNRSTAHPEGTNARQDAKPREDSSTPTAVLLDKKGASGT